VGATAAALGVGGRSYGSVLRGRGPHVWTVTGEEDGGRGRVRWPRRSSVAGARVPGMGPSAEELSGRSKGSGERRTGAGVTYIATD